MWTIYEIEDQSFSGPLSPVFHPSLAPAVPKLDEERDPSMGIEGKSRRKHGDVDDQTWPEPRER